MPFLEQLRNRRGNFNLGDPFSALTPDEIRRRMEYERNNPVPMRADGVKIGPVTGRLVSVPVPRTGAYTDRRARPSISLRPVRRPQPFSPVDQSGGRPMPQPVLTPQPQPFQPQPAPPQFGQVEEQPQFNQQGMQQMMQMMQQMMQMISQFSNQGGFGGGFGGGYGGGMGGGFGRGYGSMGGPFGQMMRPRPRPMFDYFSQNPFTRY